MGDTGAVPGSLGPPVVLNQLLGGDSEAVHGDCVLLTGGAETDLVLEVELTDSLDLSWQLHQPVHADHPGGGTDLLEVDVPLELHVLEAECEGLTELEGLGGTAHQLDGHQRVGGKDVLRSDELCYAVVQHLLVHGLHW